MGMSSYYSSLRDNFYRGCLGMSLNNSSHLVVWRRRPLCWVGSELWENKTSAIQRLTELYKWKNHFYEMKGGCRDVTS